jgi:nucleoside-diphosphate-sugar epimerase
VTTRVFLAGATGVIGIRAVRLLRDAGYEVFGTTRTTSKSEALCLAGAMPVVVDVFDADALHARMMSIRPSIVMHQLTDLPRAIEPARLTEVVTANARVRSEGTRNLVAAARACGATRFIAQSIAWAYAPGPTPHSERDPLDIEAQGARAITIAGVIALETQAMEAPPLEGVVLRYGRLYGPGTGVHGRADDPAVHVDAAAHAALLAIERVESGIFNIAEECALVSTESARRELGWSSSFRLQP